MSNTDLSINQELNMAKAESRIRLVLQDHVGKLSFVSSVITCIICTLFFKPYTENIAKTVANNQSSFASFSLAVFGILLTHKSIVLSIDKEKHFGLKKLNQKQAMMTRFRKMLNYPMWLSLCVFFASSTATVYKEKQEMIFCVILPLGISLGFQLVRFLLIFEIVFEKSISND